MEIKENNEAGNANLGLEEMLHNNNNEIVKKEDVKNEK